MPSKLASNKDIRELQRKAEALGWVVNKTKNGHVRFRAPDGRVAFATSTKTTGRGVLNAIADLKRAGLS